MARLSIEDSGVIFRNPLPGHRVINAFYPNTVRLPSGQILATLRIAGALYSPDGVLELFRSDDGGRTWQRQGPVIQNDQTTGEINYGDGFITVLRDGSLVLRTTRTDQTGGQLVFNPETGGVLPIEHLLLRSSDDGRSWSEPVASDLQGLFADQFEVASCSPIIELEDGSWFHTVETWNTYDHVGPFALQTYGVFSRDGGRTWTDRIDVANGAKDDRAYSHSHGERLPDGRIFLTAWAAESQLQSDYDVHTVVSTDATGRQWEAPLATGIPGQTSCSVHLGDGRVLIVYSHREGTEQPGIKVVASEDDGRTWLLDKPLVIWDAYGKESLGVARTDTYPSSHDAIAYGAPRIIGASDDGTSALATFWCTQGADTHCRWCRVAID